MPSTRFSRTPAPPYYAVIFTAQRKVEDKGYSKMAEQMEKLAKEQPGFLGIESTEDIKGFEITISYWDSEKSIASWKAHLKHQAAQHQGRGLWYQHYEIRVAKVERAYNLQSSSFSVDE